MKTVKRPDGWWIEGLPKQGGDLGPYDTKAEADDDRCGVQRFYEISFAPIEAELNAST